MLWEVVANAIDQHLSGCARRLDVQLEGATAIVKDDGVGLPVDEVRDGLSLAEEHLTVPHGSPTADGHFPHVHIGHQIHGVGLAPVNCLCSSLEVEVGRGGRAYRLNYERGHCALGVVEEGVTDKNGTTLRFTADREIFGDCSFNTEQASARLQELAYLNPELEIWFQGSRLIGGDGLGTMCDRMLGPADTRVTPEPIRFMGYEEKVAVDAAFGWRRTGPGVVKTFACQARTLDGGSHERGFWEGLRRALTLVGYLGSVDRIKTERFRTNVGNGLVAVVHAGLFSPEYDSPTKSQLRTKEALTAVRHVVTGGFAVYLAQHPELAKHLVGLTQR